MNLLLILIALIAMSLNTPAHARYTGMSARSVGASNHINHVRNVNSARATQPLKLNRYRRSVNQSIAIGVPTLMMLSFMYNNNHCSRKLIMNQRVSTIPCGLPSDMQ